VRGKPESKFGDFIHFENIFKKSFKLLHKAGCKVAILKQNPISIDNRLIQNIFRFLVLSLSKRNNQKFVFGF
jgi:hypothetical protein